MSLIIKLVDLILYSNLWIALGAASMVWQMQILAGTVYWPSALAAFIFFSTLFIYAMHRVIGFSIIDRTIPNRRLEIITTFQSHIVIYAAIAALGLILSAYFINLKTLLLFIPAAVISALYISPLFKKKRLRDLPHIKIFLIAMVWSWITTCIPLIVESSFSGIQIGIIGLEKFLFVLTITLPFDIRDMQVDDLHQVQTIPLRIGRHKTRTWISILLISLFIVIVLAFFLNVYSVSQTTGLLVFYIVLNSLIQLALNQDHDYYYSGLLDGTFLLQFLFVLLFTQLSSLMS